MVQKKKKKKEKREEEEKEEEEEKYNNKNNNNNNNNNNNKHRETPRYRNLFMPNYYFPSTRYKFRNQLPGEALKRQ